MWLPRRVPLAEHREDPDVRIGFTCAAATIAWAADNTITRPLAERDPLDVVAAKASLGASFTTLVAFAFVFGEALPSPLAASTLLACGATGYGVSLRLYLLAQRRIGAGRTGSVFAVAPFVGAAIALAIGDRSAGSWMLAATAFFVFLHVSEQHAHHHVHQPVEHDHLHRHDDGHHVHVHEPPFTGAHAHLHRHEHREHVHEHTGHASRSRALTRIIGTCSRSAKRMVESSW